MGVVGKYLIIDVGVLSTEKGLLLQVSGKYRQIWGEGGPKGLEIKTSRSYGKRWSVGEKIALKRRILEKIEGEINKW